MYKLSDLVDVDLTEYIGCIEDLNTLIDKLPAQQYIQVLSKLQQNVLSSSIKESIMQKRGNQAQLTSFSQKSAVITEQHPQLGLQRIQTDEEVRTTVTVRVLPLHWVNANKGSRAQLFNFMRINIDKLVGTVFLDAIFVAYWD